MWLQGVGKIYSRPLFASETVTCLIQFQTDFEVGNGVGRHKEFVSV